VVVVKPCVAMVEQTIARKIFNNMACKNCNCEECGPDCNCVNCGDSCDCKKTDNSKEDSTEE
jgi:hypothetical protein